MVLLALPSLACQSDLECVDDNPCTQGLCRANECVFNTIECGFPCGDGKVCSGEDACVQVIPTAGGYCLCDSMCQLGYHCRYTKCTQSVCPDGKCEHECGLCDEDCSRDTCKNNRVCDVKLGENCLSDPTDCPCLDKYCDPQHTGADERGCYLINCGDGECETPFESSANCCNDCGCDDPGDACNTTTQRCQVKCGDGMCEPDECLGCSLDCGPEQCNDTACVPEIGENCLTSKDCVCNPVVTFAREDVEMAEGEVLAFYFDVENAGNITDSYVVDIINGSFGMEGWYRQIAPMEPGDTEQFSVRLKAPFLSGRDPELSDIIVKVRSDQAQELFTTRYTFTVTPMGFFQWLLSKTVFRYVMQLKNLYDALEIVLLPLVGLYLIKTYVIDKKEEKPAGPVAQQAGPQWRPPQTGYGRSPGQYAAPPKWGGWNQQRGAQWQRR